jgi:hypothetical protein
LSYSSDHNPILLVFGSNNDFREDSKDKTQIKRFENIWIQDTECRQIIKTTWEQTNNEVQERLQSVITKVHQWGKTTYGNVPKEIKLLQDRINNLKMGTPSRNQLHDIKQLEAKLDEMLHQEEQWWAQRAKVKWLQHGDKNSKYFHFKATQRKRKNMIDFINDNQGHRQTRNRDIHTIFLDYFTTLFSSSNPSNIQDSLHVVANRVHPQMFNYLNQEFTAAEVSLATHQLKSNAAPGPDGLNAKFYQEYWDIIGGDITKAALHILNHGGNPAPFNNTFICLIPKNNNPSTPS